MDELRVLLDELHQYVQAFENNNTVLVENWQDRKSDYFSNTCITVVNGSCQEYMQTVEQTRSGINSSIEHLKAMIEELEKEMNILR